MSASFERTSGFCWLLERSSSLARGLLLLTCIFKLDTFRAALSAPTKDLGWRPAAPMGQRVDVDEVDDDWWYFEQGGLDVGWRLKGQVLGLLSPRRQNEIRLALSVIHTFPTLIINGM